MPEALHTAAAPVDSAGRRVDLTVAALFFVVAAFVGGHYVIAVVHAGGKPMFYQAEFGPAVMFACGHGYVNPDAETNPDLKAFLAVERDSLDCSSLAQVRTISLSPMQVAFRYLMTTVGLTWKIRGLSWLGLAPLYGIFFGATVAIGYGIFRAGMGRLLAVAGAIALTGSTIHLIYLPHLRDYAKAPFLLGLVLILATMVRRAVAPARLLLLSAAYGIVLGVGVGFRNDLLIALPPFAAVVMFFLPGPILDRLALKTASLGLCAAMVVLAMVPMRAIYATGGGNSMQHVVLLGLGDTFNEALGVTNDGLYDWTYGFQDEFAHAVVSGYATRVHGIEEFVPLYGPVYDRNAAEYLTYIARNFPADMEVRLYAAVLKVLAVPFNATSLQAPTGLTDPFVIRGYHLRERLLRPLGAAWPWILVLTLAAMSVADLRLAAILCLGILYFSAYPVLQFGERHYFHLEFIAWLLLGVFIEGAISVVRTLVRRGRGAPAWIAATGGSGRLRPRIVRAAVCGAVVLAAAGGTIVALRRYQETHVRGLFKQFESLDRESLDLASTAIDNGRVLIDSPGRVGEVWAAKRPEAVYSQYIVADFGGERCDALKLDVTFRYRTASAFNDFSRTMQIRPPIAPASTTRIFFPAYFHTAHSPSRERTAYGLGGVELPAAAASCLIGLSRVRDVTGLRMLPVLMLPPAWEQATLYYTIDGLERRARSVEPLDVYTSPADLPVGRSLLARAVQPVREGDIEQRAATLRTAGGLWSISGEGGIGGKGRFLYLARMKPHQLREGDYAIARGRLADGGVTFGLVQDGRWVAQVGVTKPGDFVVVVQVPRDGAYALVLANNLPGPSLRNDLTVTTIGVVAGT